MIVGDMLRVGRAVPRALLSEKPDLRADGLEFLDNLNRLFKGRIAVRRAVKDKHRHARERGQVLARIKSGCV